MVIFHSFPPIKIDGLPETVEHQTLVPGTQGMSFQHWKSDAKKADPKFVDQSIKCCKVSRLYIYIIYIYIYVYMYTSFIGKLKIESLGTTGTMSSSGCLWYNG